MKGLVMGVALFAAIGLVSFQVANAYEEAPVSGGGSISGKISFKGTPPPPKSFDLAKFPQATFCGKADSDGQGHRLLKEVKVKDGALGDVVVYISGIEKGKPFKFEGTDVKTDTCRFLVQGGPSTFVGVVAKMAELRVENLDADPADPKSVDGVLHNPHGYEVKGASSATMFNKPLPTKGQVLKEKVKLRKPESFMKLECDQHNYMNVYFQPIDNPYYAIVGEDGAFSIGDLPAGEYTVKAFHPILGTKDQKITVAANGKAIANFEFSK
jgi:hypothetical protein